MNHPRVRAVLIVSVLGVLGIGSLTYAAVSFIGRGRVDVDSLKSNGKIESIGSISNPARNQPLRLLDDLVVGGNIALQGRTARISAPGGNAVTIDDSAVVTGALGVSGPLITGGVIVAAASENAVTVNDELHVNQGLVVD